MLRKKKSKVIPSLWMSLLLHFPTCIVVGHKILRVVAFLPPMLLRLFILPCCARVRPATLGQGLDTLRRHLPVSHEAGLQELRKIAVRFEEKIYSAATSQSDYLRKISLKMLTMESKSQTSSGSSFLLGLLFLPDYIRKMIILEDDLDESKSQSILLNALHSNSTDMNGNLPELAIKLCTKRSQGEGG
ncbi:hypothetical protein Cgig2_013233 [Carnegiea gigantea]|uniref:Mediator complex subunit 15 KIX domain-containing protein n=1 Tax=Carnegiea gigantea TaxID=171969 RepID=A0A9Q1GMG3_9CARY|nr:hypothetical protein Cgig2_013233 [Carnegiea gigantea]